MIERRLARQLDKVTSRFRYRSLFWTWSTIWLALALVTGVLVLAAVGDEAQRMRLASILGGVGLLFALLAIWQAGRLTLSPLELAQRIERRFPDLRASLLTAIDQQPDAVHGRLGYMQQRVVDQALRHAYAHPWQQVIPLWQVWIAMLANGCGLSLFVAALFVLVTAEESSAILLRTLSPAEIKLTEATHAVTIEPGSTEVERNSSLLVLARFADELPADARLWYQFADGEAGQIGMLKSLDDPVFGGRVPAVRGPMEYRVEFAGQVSATYTVTVFEYPRLVRADALLEFPQYTAWEPRRLEDTRRVSAVEGTQLTLTCMLNKPVASARLLAADGSTLELQATAALTESSTAARAIERSPTASNSTTQSAISKSPSPVSPASDSAVTAVETTSPSLDTPIRAEGSAPSVAASESFTPSVTTPSVTTPSVTTPPVTVHPYAVTWVLSESQKYKLELVDEAGRRNQQEIEFVITVLPNQPPDLKLVAPARDLEVSPLEELELRANVWDDFGVQRFGIQYTLVGEEPHELVLANAVAGRVRTEVAHTIALEELEAAPDELVSYHFWAEDTAPDGSSRRTLSDMYFAEVRHFEEIFRQGQQPTSDQQQASEEQQESGAAAQAAELAELQKQIINATWKVLRRETSAKPSSSFATDAGSLVQSQQQALEQLNELVSGLQDANSKQHANAAAESMKQALQQLQKALDTTQSSPLTPALAAEQAAYQGLLKLRAREHEVVRGNSRSSRSSRSASSSSRSQQQLQQLQLREDENRYETENMSRNQTEQTEEDRETRQVLNRLRELAQRQGDLNERLKELTAALQEATNEEQREEIRQQLKRLREEQQQIMRDAEELQSRMEQPANQERMQSAQQQLSETRENLREASEALEEGQVSRAITSGTRAEQSLETLRDEFRQKAAGRFDEEMRELQERARELDETQQRLAEQMRNEAQPSTGQPSLRDSGKRAEIQQELQQQQQRLDQLTKRMTETVEEAETSEPLLANSLYEAVRRSQQQRLDEAIQATERSLANGLLEDAQQLEKVAQEGIRELRAGVDRAAESVLGDESEALSRARDQLNELINQVQSEVQRARPDLALDTSSQPTDEPLDQPGAAARDAARQSADGARDGARSPEAEQNAGPQSQTAEANGKQPEKAGPDQPARGEREPMSNPDNTQPKGGQPGQQQPGQQQPGQQQPGQQQPGQQQAGQQQLGQQQPGQQPPGQQQPGQQPGQGRASSANPAAGQPNAAQDQAATDARSPGQPERSGSPSAEMNEANRMREGSQSGLGGLQQLIGPGVPSGPEVAPLTGEAFRQWSDQLRDVEEMIGDPELSAEAARIRDRARGFRQDFRRHSADPNWDLVQLEVVKPLVELRDRVTTELLKRTTPEALVPIDRDPVPPRFSDPVRKYFERLGTGR